MKTLSFDPSLTRTGWALFVDGNLHSYGAIEPKRAKKLTSRLLKIDKDVCDLINLLGPDQVLIESSSGHVAGRHQRDGGAKGRGLSRYGMAVGAVILRCCHDLGEDSITLIDENTWTRRVSKANRQQAIIFKYPQYDPEEDQGGDISDAIGVWEWWTTEQLVHNAVTALE